MYKEFKTVFVGELRDIYSAESQIAKAFPRLVKAVHSKELKQVINAHLKEAKAQKERLKTIFKILKATAGRETCEATKGLLKECQKTVKDYPLSPMRDMALITKLQRIEHYEIAVYGSLRAFAKKLKLDEVAFLLTESLEEEEKADKALSKIAEGHLFKMGVNEETLTVKRRK